MAVEQILNLVLPGLILAAILGLCSWAIVRRWIRKKPISAGSQYLGQNIYMQYQNAERRRSIEQVMFKKEDERNEEFSGEDFENGTSNEEG